MQVKTVCWTFLPKREKQEYFSNQQRFCRLCFGEQVQEYVENDRRKRQVGHISMSM